MIGNNLSITEYLELNNFNGLSYDNLISLSKKRLKNKFNCELN